MPLDLGSMNLEERTKYLELKERYKKQLRPWYKKWWGVLMIIILGLILIVITAAGFYVYNKVQEIRAEDAYNQKINASESLRLAIYGKGINYSLGPDSAELIIVEFSDFACPYCQQSHTVLQKIIDRYPGRVKIIFRDMPLHLNSVELALGARCAGEQGKFWEMHNQLFANQSLLSGTGDELAKVIYNLASTIELDADTFSNCYSSKKYLGNISADRDDGYALQLSGTPSWFLNGKLLVGYIPELDFIALLENTYFNK